MKRLSLFTILLLCSCAAGSLLAATNKSKKRTEQDSSSKKKESQQAKPAPKKDDDEDEKVVLQNFTNMLNAFANITTSPHKPEVVGANAAAMMASFVNVLVQVFKGTPIAAHKASINYLENYFENLSKEEYALIVSCIVSKAHELNQSICENAEVQKRA